MDSKQNEKKWFKSFLILKTNRFNGENLVYLLFTNFLKNGIL